jgi:pSer/pThr/pTyr-binding forkhead associated (FHA) protein
MSKLRISNGPYSGREITLEDEPITIGRDADATVQILDRSASRVHSEVFPVGGMYFVRDLDSKNGTLVNDQRITDEELLREGDIIKIGSTELIFESGIALSDTHAGDRIAYSDEVNLSNTIEIKIDDLADIQDATEDRADDRFMRILYQFAKALSSEEIDPVARALDLLIEALPCDNANVLIRQGNSNKLAPRCVRTAHAWSKPVIARSIIRRTLTENRAVLTENAKSDRRFNRQESVVGQNIRSVVCVPITMSGSTRGVFYVSRGIGEESFDHQHLELLSGCAVQLGMHLLVQEQMNRVHQVQWTTMVMLVRSMEHDSPHQGRGERCARVIRGLATKLELDEAHQRPLMHAGLLHHLPEVLPQLPNDDYCSYLGTLSEPLLELIRTVQRKLAGENVQDASAEARILLAAVQYERLVSKHSDQDALALITQLDEAEDADRTVLKALRSAYLEKQL